MKRQRMGDGMKEHFPSKADLDAFLADGLADGTLVGKALHMLILHGEACTPSICICDPEYVLEELTVDNYEAGQKAQNDWVKDSTS